MNTKADPLFYEHEQEMTREAVSSAHMLGFVLIGNIVAWALGIWALIHFAGCSHG